MESDYTFLAVPSRGQVITPLALALLRASRKPVGVHSHCCSLLTLSFNSLWCAALNQRPRVSHFAMCHDDIQPIEDNWLDTLREEFDACGADVLSCVVGIKDSRGLSSTAVMHRPTRRMRRITMTEAQALPKTFDAARAGYPDCAILPNTGLWICDFRKPWVERVCFTMRDRIFRDPKTGEWTPQCFGEDWHFGVQLADMGLKVCATTAVKVLHQGKFDYPNFEAWGEWKEDQQTNIVWNWDHERER